MSIIKIIGSSRDYDEFMRKLVEETTVFLGLKVGHYFNYMINSDQLETSNVFYVNDDVDYDEFIDVTKKFVFKLGVGLPGVAWKEEKTVNYKNVFKVTNFPRAKANKNIKIKGGVAIPVFCKEKLHGVLEMYSDHEINLFEEKAELCNHLSLHIGSILELYQKSRDNHLILQAIGEGVYGLDLNGNTTFINTAANNILGYTREELIGKPMHRIAHYAYADGSDYPHEMCPMYSSFREGKTHHIDNEVLWHKDGHSIPVRYTSVPILENGVLQGSVVTFLDITKEKESKERLKKLAHYDTLTSLANRYTFSKYLNQSIVHAEENHATLTVMYIDVDNFKSVNDTLGHEFGDFLLYRIGNRLLHIVHEGDFVARLGGDEFACIISRFVTFEDISKLTSKIIVSLNKPVIISGQEIQVSVSIGIATYPRNGKNTSDLLKNADIAMYQAKKDGKNNFVFFEKNLNDQVKRVKKIETELSKAIERNELSLYYQPILDLKSHKIKSIEALIRWENKELGDPSPLEFIKVAESCGLIEPLSQWIIEQSLDDFIGLKRYASLKSLNLSINISAKQFANDHLMNSFIKQIGGRKLDYSSVTIEVTETAIMSDIDRASFILNVLNKAGVKVALDDFGTGYSSLLYLKKLPINYIKIDREFIRDTLVDTNDMLIVKAMIKLSHNLNLQVIAEGVEEKEQLDFLGENDCDMFQGFLYYKPMPLKQFIKVFGSNVSEDGQ